MGEVIGPRDNVFPGPAVALDGPGFDAFLVFCLIRSLDLSQVVNALEACMFFVLDPGTSR